MVDLAVIGTGSHWHRQSLAVIATGSHCHRRRSLHQAAVHSQIDSDRSRFDYDSKDTGRSEDELDVEEDSKVCGLEHVYFAVRVCVCFCCGWIGCPTCTIHSERTSRMPMALS